MPMTKRDIFALTAGAILLVGITAGASAYYLNSDDAVEERSQAVSQIQPAAATTRTTTQAAPAPLPECDDDNIVGKVVGGVGGGLLGAQVGSGSGKTAATIGGSVGGTILGEKYVPTKNVTCR